MSETDPAHQSEGSWRKACQLVGEFMWHWASLEQEVNKSYRKLLRIKGINGYIAVANITLRDKISAIRTVVHMAAAELSWWRAADKDLTAIATMNNERRNLVAHNAFMGHSSGGVEFLIIKAKGKLDIPDVVWTPEEFEQVFAEVERLRERLKETTSAVLGPDLPPPSGKNIFALPPTPAPNGLTGLLALGHQTLASLGYPSPSPTEEPQTPEALPPKRKGSRKPKD